MIESLMNYMCAIYTPSQEALGSLTVYQCINLWYIK